MPTTLPKGCFDHIDHNRILSKDIHSNRPCDQTSISTERALSHRLMIKDRPRIPFFRRKPYWAVFSTTTYEMAGVYCNTFMGGRAWAETDMTGLEWHFDNEKDAQDFVIKTP
jgi:hypothetical protein